MRRLAENAIMGKILLGEGRDLGNVGSQCCEQARRQKGNSGYDVYSAQFEERE
jgi:hypothetical protein